MCSEGGKGRWLFEVASAYGEWVPLFMRSIWLYVDFFDAFDFSWNLQVFIFWCHSIVVLGVEGSVITSVVDVELTLRYEYLKHIFTSHCHFEVFIKPLRIILIDFWRYKNLFALQFFR